MDLKDLEKLIQLFEKSQLASLELNEGKTAVKLTKTSPTINVNEQQVYYQPSLQPQREHSLPLASVKDANLASTHFLCSPMVGTFYTSSSPDKPPFVKIGDKVQAGQVVCIIEAMKILNQIEADKSGIIKEILVENGQPVEFEQPLFTIA